MQKWEYMVLEIHIIGAGKMQTLRVVSSDGSEAADKQWQVKRQDIPKHRAVILNSFGSAGWELVTQDRSHRFTFKRLL